MDVGAISGMTYEANYNCSTSHQQQEEGGSSALAAILGVLGRNPRPTCMKGLCWIGSLLETRGSPVSQCNDVIGFWGPDSARPESSARDYAGCQESKHLPSIFPFAQRNLVQLKEQYPRSYDSLL